MSRCFSLVLAGVLCLLPIVPAVAQFGSHPPRANFELPAGIDGLVKIDDGARAVELPPEPKYSVPLGIGLETWPYPYPVKFLPLEIEGQTARMAYMDVQFQFIQAPPRSGTVLLLHGKNFYGSYWDSTIAALASQGYRVIVPDQIGFGKSSKPEINYSFDLLARNTAQLLDALDVKQVAVVGHSMGGMLAVRFARNYPERVTHLILENPIGLEDYRFKVPPRTTQELYRAELDDTQTTKIRALLKGYPAKWKPEVFEPFVEARRRVALSGEYLRFAKAAALTYQMIYQQPVRHEFGLIAAPTLLVIGQEDRTALGRGFVSPQVRAALGQYPRLGREAARDIPHAKLVELAGVGHIPHLETPARWQQELLEFLKPQSKEKNQ